MVLEGKWQTLPQNNWEYFSCLPRVSPGINIRSILSVTLRTLGDYMVIAYWSSSLASTVAKPGKAYPKSQVSALRRLADGEGSQGVSTGETRANSHLECLTFVLKLPSYPRPFAICLPSLPTPTAGFPQGPIVCSSCFSGAELWGAALGAIIGTCSQHNGLWVLVGETDWCIVHGGGGLSLESMWTQPLGPREIDSFCRLHFFFKAWL